MTILDNVKWNSVDAKQSDDDGLPYVTHEGTLQIGDFSLQCFQLSDGQRVIDAESLRKFFGADIAEVLGIPREVTR